MPTFGSESPAARPPFVCPGGRVLSQRADKKGTPMEIAFLVFFPLGLCALAGGIFLPPLLRHPARD